MPVKTCLCVSSEIWRTIPYPWLRISQLSCLSTFEPLSSFLIAITTPQFTSYLLYSVIKKVTPAQLKKNFKHCIWKCVFIFRRWRQFLLLMHLHVSVPISAQRIIAGEEKQQANGVVTLRALLIFQLHNVGLVVLCPNFKKEQILHPTLSDVMYAHALIWLLTQVMLSCHWKCVYDAHFQIIRRKITPQFGNFSTASCSSSLLANIQGLELQTPEPWLRNRGLNSHRQRSDWTHQVNYNNKRRNDLHWFSKLYHTDRAF